MPKKNKAVKEAPKKRGRPKKVHPKAEVTWMVDPNNSKAKVVKSELLHAHPAPEKENKIDFTENADQTDFINDILAIIADKQKRFAIDTQSAIQRRDFEAAHTANHQLMHATATLNQILWMMVDADDR